jgi:hypothetical protein
LAVKPKVTFEIAFESNPVDSTFAWTTVDGVQDISYTRGQPNEYDRIETGESTVNLGDATSALDANNIDSPYYPNVRPMRPTRALITTDGEASSPLTVSGNEITDATRAAAQAWGVTRQGGQTDGLQGDGSFFIGRAATNRHPHGQCDSLANYGAVTGATHSLDPATRTQASPQSVKVVTPGVAQFEGEQAYTATGQAAAAGVFGSGSIAIEAAVGVQVDVWLRWINTDASLNDGAKTTYTGTGTVERVTPAPLAVAAGKTGDQLIIYVRTHTVVATIFWVGNPMLEVGQSVVAPYVPTSGGATATKPAARVQAPASLLDETQGGIVLRLAMGYDASAALTQNNVFFEWQDSANERLVLDYMRAPTQTWRIAREHSGTFQSVVSAAQTFHAGDEVTVIACWDAGNVKISVNGGPFVSAAAALIPTLAATMFDIGSAGGGALVCDSRVKWAATFEGTLTDADAAWLDGELQAGNEPWPSDINEHAPAAQCTATFPFDDTSYIVSDVDYPLFQHFIERLPRKARLGNAWTQRELTGTDAFAWFALTGLAGKSYTGEPTGSRWGHVLDDCTWPAGRRNIDTGSSSLDPSAFAADDSTKALTHLLDVVDNENGFGFMDAGGDARFIARHTFITSTEVQATFADVPSLAEYPDAIPYTDLQPESTEIINDYSGQRDGGTAQTASDTTSSDSYGPRSEALTFLVDSDTEVADALQWRLSRTKDPYERIDSLTVKPGASIQRWVVVLGLEIGDRITVVEWPPGFSGPVANDYLIRHLAVSIPTSVVGATFTFQLTPVDQDSFVVLDDTQAGQLDANKLAY